jgi:hypothetical protein
VFHLSEAVKITADAPTVTGTTTIDSTEIDMAGWDGVMWIVRLGSPAANNNIRAQQDTVTGMGTAADLTGTLVNHATKNVHVLDLKRPQEQFVRCRVTRGTTTTIDCLVAIQYRGRNSNFSQPASVVLERWHGPVEGTA